MHMKRLKSLAFVYASIFSLLIGLGAGIFLTISSELISLFWSKRILAHPGLLLLQCLLWISDLVEKEKAVGLKAVTDGEFRRSWWHLDFLWGLKGEIKYDYQ